MCECVFFHVCAYSCVSVRCVSTSLMLTTHKHEDIGMVGGAKPMKFLNLRLELT